MISRDAKTLENRFYDELMQTSCQNDLDNLLTFIDIEGMSFLEVRQAYSLAVLKASASHIENCYDTPHNGEDRTGSGLDPQTYIDWMNIELAKVKSL